VLLHGDLYARHLLMADGRLEGVIDWGDVHIGDRAADLAVAEIVLPPSSRAAFWAAYADGGHTPTAGTLARVAARAIHHCVLVLQFARSVEDADLLREAMLGLSWASGSA
jgi:aminoglycoside phosphotransferase (APT) family kinase protein